MTDIADFFITVVSLSRESTFPSVMGQFLIQEYFSFQERVSYGQGYAKVTIDIIH